MSKLSDLRKLDLLTRTKTLLELKKTLEVALCSFFKNNFTHS